MEHDEDSLCELANLCRGATLLAHAYAIATVIERCRAPRAEAARYQRIQIWIVRHPAKNCNE